MQAPHDLLRLRDPRDLVHRVPTPSWVCEALLLAPWVVVRRAPFENELIPVGVRGRNRSERFAAFAHAASIVQCAKPEELAAGQSWRTAPRREELPAMRALPPIHAMLRKLGLAWGPIGSVGFELASGLPAANSGSDLDLLIRVQDTVLPRTIAEDLVAFMEGVGVRVDVGLETTAGGIALAEYARGVPELLLRTLNGPRLIRHPRW
ncbi:MAG: malonate decarboxylase holo-ACP synthase [Verrucomicrobia bacterium]|nr:malonate decarboxylase holo-ACP synthase [Verrucomicrobiota bacterium]